MFSGMSAPTPLGSITILKVWFPALFCRLDFVWKVWNIWILGKDPSVAIIGVPNKGSNKSIPQFKDKVDIGDKQVE